MKHSMTEDEYTNKLIKNSKKYSIYDDISKNSVDRNVIKKISILYDIFTYINKKKNNNSKDFIYTNDIKHSLKYDDFVRIRFHIIPIERKGINNLDSDNYNYIEQINNTVSNIYNPSSYDQFLNNRCEEDTTKLYIMLKNLNEIECAYIYKYRSDNNIKLTFDVFSHNFYIFLSYDYKKKLAIKNFKNKYNQIKIDNEYKYSMNQNIMELNSIGMVLNTHLNSYEQEVIDKLNPFIYESEHIIKELHTKKNKLKQKYELENSFFFNHNNYEDEMRKLIHTEKRKEEYKRLSKHIGKNFIF
ncbi:conserved protein, unknown function [Hepatocystis sp. ex Piliocolobus tephrosceles]|nr:conserved protein, unknown function [Hepatocystis sp. ex Piliocolobus tephrosceles]